MRTENGKGWQVLGQDQPIVSTGKVLAAELLPTRDGLLRLSAQNGEMPEGECLLILSNRSELSHWYTSAKVERGVLTARLSGTEMVFEGEDSLMLAMAVRTERGLVQYPLSGNRYARRYRRGFFCPYFYDNRDLWSGSVDRFSRDGMDFAVLPGFVPMGEKKVPLSLIAVPEHLRYAHQLSYGIEAFSHTADRLCLTLRAVEGGLPLEGVVLHDRQGAAVTPVFPLTGEQPTRAELPLAALELPKGRYTLAGVVDGDGYIPLAAINNEAHRAMGDPANGAPLRQCGAGCVYLTLDELCRAGIAVETDLPGQQRGIAAGTLAQALAEKTLEAQGQLCVVGHGGDEWRWSFSVPNRRFDDAEELQMVLRWKGIQICCPVTANEDGSLTAELRSVADHLLNSLITRWELFLAARQGECFTLTRLQVPERIPRLMLNTDPVFLNRRESFSAPIGSVQLEQFEVTALLCTLTDGFCKLQTCGKARMYENQLVCRAEEVRLEGSRLVMRVRCPHIVPGRWSRFAILHRYKLDADRIMHTFEPDDIEVGEHQTIMTVKADLSRIELVPLYWDIRAVFSGEDGTDYLVRIRPVPENQQEVKETEHQKRRKQVGRFLRPESYRQGKELSVSLYRTIDFNYALVCQERSPYSGPWFRLKERAALVLARLMKKRLAQKSIILCYEKYCCMAQDNGYYFFRYCMENGMEEKMHRSIYYVIDKKQPDYKERLLPYKDHVIQFMSLKHMVYILGCRLLVASDSKPHAYAWRAKESVILPRVLNRKKLVFLQHGVIALKRVEFYSKGPNAVNLFVTSNQREHDIIEKEMEYPSEDVIITGLARWDVLEDKKLTQRRVLVMPTWRNWLEEVSDEAFITSDYYQNYMKLLNDPRLEALLERQDVYLDFYIHPKFREYMDQFSILEGGRIRLIPFGEEPLNQLIMGCKLLITDYSSVCWDVYYQGKPVLFYQFDLERYNETTGSYIDMEKELFGDRVLTTDALLEKLEEYAANDFALPEVYAEMRPHMYAYIDHNNSKRTCEEIMKRNW